MLLIGSFIVALAVEKVNLHRRIALRIIMLIGTTLNRCVQMITLQNILHYRYYYANCVMPRYTVMTIMIIIIYVHIWWVHTVKSHLKKVKKNGTIILITFYGL